jgi:fatty-acid desaturase
LEGSTTNRFAVFVAVGDWHDNHHRFQRAARVYEEAAC